jgi:hypothetical protein
MIWPDESSFTLFPWKPTIQNSWFQRWNTEEILWRFGQQYNVQYSVGPIIIFHGRITAKEYMNTLAIRCIPWSRRLFWTTMQFYKTTMLQCTQLEVFSHGLKSMKVNFSTFPG